MVLRTFYHTLRHPLLWAGSRAARGKTAVNVTLNRLYCMRAAKYNLAGRGLETLGFEVLESLKVDRQVWRSQ
jgi:hypothetical protein